jgi:hypothetical protein
MSIETNKLMSLADGQVLYNDLRGRIEENVEDVSDLKNEKADRSELDDLADMIGAGMSMTAVNLLTTILGEALYGTDQSANLTLLENELKKVKPISISAVLSETSRPLVGLPYSDLEFIVTATFDDESTAVMESYVIKTSGNVVAGSNTVTILCRGLTTTVTFAAEEVVTYTITNNLTNVTTSNNQPVIVENERYVATITANQDHYINAVEITMGGIDITNTAYNAGEIVIQEVTGNVVITVSAAEYVYLPDLIRRRAGFDSTAYFSPDNHTSQDERYRYNNAFIGSISEYPAKTNTEVTWTITNISDENVSIVGLGFALASMNDSIFVSENEYAYYVPITNVGNTLQPGETLSGTYLWRAGYQLVCTTFISDIDHLQIRLRGAYDPETFVEYDEVIKYDKAITKVSKPYADFTCYTDNGVTILEVVKSSVYYRITDDLTEGEYDIVYRYVNKYSGTYNNNVNKAVFAPFAEPIGSQVSANYAVGYTDRNKNIPYISNLWCYGKLIVSSSGMSLITTNDSQLAENGIANGYGYFELRMKEAVE